ncbi:MAG TPA: hypothetical protein VLJ88_07425, partial [Propionibacteriaceae bacterium]|nr:hypothetical protein [Propionibacteriaceae bacterium]
MRDAEEVRVPTGGTLRTVRRIARFVPFHRVFHSVELSLLILVAALIDVFVDGRATEVLLAGLVIAAAVTVVGHLAAVLASSRLR